MIPDDGVIARMGASPLLVLSDGEVKQIAQMVQTPEEIATALWDYAWISWQRGQRFERSCAGDRETRWWGNRVLRALRVKC